MDKFVSQIIQSGQADLSLPTRCLGSFLAKSSPPQFEPLLVPGLLCQVSSKRCLPSLSSYALTDTSTQCGSGLSWSQRLCPQCTLQWDTESTSFSHLCSFWLPFTHIFLFTRRKVSESTNATSFSGLSEKIDRTLTEARRLLTVLFGKTTRPTFLIRSNFKEDSESITCICQTRGDPVYGFSIAALISSQ